MTSQVLDLDNLSNSCGSIGKHGSFAFGAAGGLVNEQTVLICGGEGIDKCFKLGSTNHNQITMQEKRGYAAAVSFKGMFEKIEYSNLNHATSRKVGGARNCLSSSALF